MPEEELKGSPKSLTFILWWLWVSVFMGDPGSRAGQSLHFLISLMDSNRILFRHGFQRIHPHDIGASLLFLHRFWVQYLNHYAMKYSRYIQGITHIHISQKIVGSESEEGILLISVDDQWLQKAYSGQSTVRGLFYLQCEWSILDRWNRT